MRAASLHVQDYDSKRNAFGFSVEDSWTYSLATFKGFCMKAGSQMALSLVPTRRYVVATGVSLWMLCSEFLVLKGRHVPVLVGFHVVPSGLYYSNTAVLGLTPEATTCRHYRG